MRKIYLAFELGEFGAHNLHAFSAKADRKKHVRAAGHRNMELAEVSLESPGATLYLAIKANNFVIQDLRGFSQESTANAFIKATNVAGFNNQNYTHHTLAVKSPRAVEAWGTPGT